MTAPEKFREAAPLRDLNDNPLCSVLQAASAPKFDRLHCLVFGCMLDVKEARALRDWLNEVLP